MTTNSAGTRVPNPRIVPATPAHALALASNMRKADVEEVWASAKVLPYEGLRASIVASRGTARAGVDGNNVICIFGIGQPSLLGDVGKPWLLGSDDMSRYAVTFLRRSRAYMEKARAEYPMLANYVDVRNALSIRWLRWLGFTLLPAEPYGPFGMPFHPFYMRQSDVR